MSSSDEISSDEIPDDPFGTLNLNQYLFPSQEVKSDIAPVKKDADSLNGSVIENRPSPQKIMKITEKRSETVSIIYREPIGSTIIESFSSNLEDERKLNQSRIEIKPKTSQVMPIIDELHDPKKFEPNPVLNLSGKFKPFIGEENKSLYHESKSRSNSKSLCNATSVVNQKKDHVATEVSLNLSQFTKPYDFISSSYISENNLNVTNLPEERSISPSEDFRDKLNATYIPEERSSSPLDIFKDRQNITHILEEASPLEEDPKILEPSSYIMPLYALSTLDNTIETPRTLEHMELVSAKSEESVKSESQGKHKDSVIPESSLRSAGSVTSNSSVNIEENLPRFAQISNIADDKCCYCGSGSELTKLSCKHDLCKGCLESHIKAQEDRIQSEIPHYPYLPHTIHCPSCSRPTNPNILKLNPFYESLQIQSKKRFFDLTREPSLRCLYCKTAQPDSMFYLDQLCKHICKDCMHSLMLIGECNCGYCEQGLNLSSKLKNMISRCGSCHNEKYVIKDLVIHLCELHTHCSSCTIQAINRKKCGQCDCDLSGDDWQKIKTIAARAQKKKTTN